EFELRLQVLRRAGLPSVFRHVLLAPRDLRGEKVMLGAELDHVLRRARSALAAVLFVMELHAVSRTADSAVLTAPLAFALITSLDDSPNRLGNRSILPDLIGAGLVDDPLSLFSLLDD